MFDTQDRLDGKIDKLTSMKSKLTTQDSNQNRPFKLKNYQGKRRGQTRNYYNQDIYQSRYRSNCGERYSRMPYRGRAQYRQSYKGHSMFKIIEVISEDEILEECKISQRSKF